MVIECFLWGAEAEVIVIYCLFQVIIDQFSQFSVTAKSRSKAKVYLGMMVFMTGD